MAREGVPLNVIQRQLGHTDLGVTSVDLRGIDNAEIIDTIHARKPPTMPASAGLPLTPNKDSVVIPGREQNGLIGTPPWFASSVGLGGSLA